jgi:ketosteroid isomerase-like protein
MPSALCDVMICGTLALVACGGEAPAPQAPPPPPAPPVASATPPPADTTPPPPPKPSLAELIPQTLAGMREAFNAHDAKKLASYCAEDCVVDSYGQPDAHGREEVARGLADLFGTFSDARSATLRSWSKGNVVVSEMAWAGTMTGDFMGMKATSKPVGQLRARMLWFNDDGLVKEMHEYADDAGLMAQMEGKKGAPPVPVLPAGTPEMHVASGAPDDDRVADWAKASDVTFSKDDAKAALAAMAEEGDYWVNFRGAPAMKGKKENEKGLAGWFKAFPDQKWTTTNALGVDGFGILEHTMSGTQKGPLGALAGSNKPVSGWHWLDIVQPAADGKVEHGWGYANLLEMMQQTGALKQPGDKPAAKVAPMAKKKK